MSSLEPASGVSGGVVAWAKVRVENSKNKHVAHKERINLRLRKDWDLMKR
jgi:hypothetical protein